MSFKLCCAITAVACSMREAEAPVAVVAPGSACMQAHELSAGSLRCLSRATRLEALCLEGISEVGDAGWASLAHLTRLTSLSVRSRGDNTGLHHVRSAATRSIAIPGSASTLLLRGTTRGRRAEP